jgi:hypothetical protein
MEEMNTNTDETRVTGKKSHLLLNLLVSLQIVIVRVILSYQLHNVNIYFNNLNNFFHFSNQSLVVLFIVDFLDFIDICFETAFILKKR